MRVLVTTQPGSSAFFQLVLLATALFPGRLQYGRQTADTNGLFFRQG
jgi:hypothetical protein